MIMRVDRRSIIIGTIPTDGRGERFQWAKEKAAVVVAEKVAVVVAEKVVVEKAAVVEKVVAVVEKAALRTRRAVLAILPVAAGGTIQRSSN